MFCSTSLAERTSQFYMQRLPVSCDHSSGGIRLTKELVVFRAYDNTKPTRPASTPVLVRATIDKMAVMKMMVAPTNSKRTASQRFTEMLGR